MVIGKIGKIHGKHGAVKIIPEPGMKKIFYNLKNITVFSVDGKKYELENIRKYTRGRFIGTLHGVYTPDELKKFQGSKIIINSKTGDQILSQPYLIQI